MACDSLTGPRIEEQIVSATESRPLEMSTGVAILIVLDDTEETQDVWGLLTNGSKLFYIDGDQPFRIRFLSTYLHASGGPLWMDGGTVVDDSAEWEGEFGYAFDQTVRPFIRQREVHTPRPRDAVRQALATDALSDFVGDDHLVVMVISAFDDHSDDTQEQRAELGWLMESQPWGSSTVLVTPQADGCMSPHSTQREGHNLSRAVFADSLVADVDVCDWGWMNPAVDAVEVASARRNHIVVTLADTPIPGTVEVFGVTAGARTALPTEQWSVTGTTLVVDPPLRGFDAVQAEYKRDVGDD